MVIPTLVRCQYPDNVRRFMSLDPQDLEQTLQLLQRDDFARALVEGSNRKLYEAETPVTEYSGLPEHRSLIGYLLGYQDDDGAVQTPQEEPVENVDLINYLVGFVPGGWTSSSSEIRRDRQRRPVNLIDHPFLGSFFQRTIDYSGPGISSSPFYPHPHEVKIYFV